jgi:serine/threonine protein kinase/Tol biopolymer transport system component
MNGWRHRVTQDPPEYRGDPAAVLGAGSWVAGYRLEEQAGAGGMAVVYRARDERLSRLVALKIMAPAMAADALFRQRFTRESRAAAAVDHPHIIPVYEAGEADGVLFIAMRFVGGGDVGSLLHREGPLPPARAVSITSPVASALDAAHAAGLVHRDIKPANMLLDTHPGRPDHVYLSDFGLSKGVQSARLTASGYFLGTPDYIAPEQIEGLPVDGRADQYALACVAFELLTAAVIFARKEGWATVWAHLNSPPPPVTSVRPDLSPAVDQVLARALAKAPQDRYASCQQFADALREALGLAPYHLDSGATPATGGTGNGSVRPAGQDTANRPVLTASMAAPVHRATEPAREAAMSRIAAVTANPARGHRAGRRRPRRRRTPIALAGVVVVAAAVTAAVLAAPAHHARPAPAVPPLFSRTAAVTAPRTPGHWQYVSSVVFSPDGRTLATGMTTGTEGSAGVSLSSGETFLWNVATGKRTLTLAGAGGTGEAFSPDGKVLAAAGGAGESSLYFWNATTGRRAADLSNIHAAFAEVAFSPDGKVLTAEDSTGVVYLWNLATRRMTFTIGKPAYPYTYEVAISPDSQTLATLQNSGARDQVYLWDIATNRTFIILTNPDDSPVSSVAFSPDGKTIAICGRNGKTSLLDTATSKLLATFTDPDSSGVTTPAFSPDGELLATGDYNGKTYLWNLRTRTLAAVLANPGGTLAPVFKGKDRDAVVSIAFSPDGKTLATSGTNGSAYLWRIR